MHDPHVSVLLEESLQWLAVRDGGLYVDATYGAGGHARAIAARGGFVLAFDRDPGARVAPGPEAARIELVSADFRDLGDFVARRGVASVDGILFDLGVSSMQFDRPERGFSLAHDGDLDMRMNPSAGESAYEFLERASETEIADAIYRYGEERASRRIARAIVGARGAGRLPRRTLELARLVSGSVHASGKRERIHPATRTFQALRIAVNDELGALEAALGSVASVLTPGGRVVAISFHSLEDRIVKHRFREDSGLHVLTKKPILPREDETRSNPRSRSAKLRAAERVTRTPEAAPR